MQKLIPVIGYNRSGATWFCQLLGSHPAVTNGGEVSGPSRYKDGERPERLLALIKGTVGVYCFNYHYHWEENLNDYLVEQLAKVILFDRNPVDTYISGMMVRQSLDMKDYPTREECFRLQHKKQTIKIKPHNLGSFIEGYLRDIALARSVFHGMHLEITYEGLVADPERVCNAALRFIGLGLCPLRSYLCKQETLPRKERVENWQEVLGHFQGSPHLHFIEEGADLI